MCVCLSLPIIDCRKLVRCVCVFSSSCLTKYIYVGQWHIVDQKLNQTAFPPICQIEFLLITRTVSFRARCELWRQAHANYIGLVQCHSTNFRIRMFAVPLIRSHPLLYLARNINISSIYFHLHALHSVFVVQRFDANFFYKS